MSKASLLKIALSLFIVGIYVFLFGIVGTVEGAGEIGGEAAVTVSETSEDASVPEESAPGETTEEEISVPTYTSLNVANAAKPHLGDYNVPMEEAVTAPPAPTESTEPPIIIDDSGYEPANSQPAATTTAAAATTQEPVQTSATTATAPAATTASTASEEAPVTTVTEATTAPVVTHPDAASETLTVYYTGSGGNVSGDAVSIISRVVMGEIGGSFDEEAIKAQAVAAYTYVRLYNDSGKVPFVAVREPNDRVIKCVSEVIGECIYYNGKLIQSVYGASTAGYTASAKTVWGVDYPYLISQYCELDAQYDPYYGKKVLISAADVKSLVYKNTGISLSGDPSQWFKIISYVDTVFVGTLSIGGQTTYVDSSGKTVNITGRALREKILDWKIHSACFEVAYDANKDQFTFTTYGAGHCVGFSQYGAQNLALYKSYDYRQILAFYFPGTQVY